MPPIAVLHLTSAEGGGADRYIRDLAATTAVRSWIWHAGAGVVEDVGATRYYRAPAGPMLTRWLAEAGIGLVHLHGVTRECGDALARIRDARAPPYIVTLHDIGFVAPHAFDGRLDGDPADHARVSQLFADAAAIVAPSAYIARLAGEHFGERAVQVIAPGIERQPVPVATVEVDDDFTAHAARMRIGVAGAIGPHKGSADIAAIAHAIAAHDATLVVIGYSDTRVERGWVTEGELYMHGAYEDHALPALLDAYGVDIVLFANRLPESFSYTLSEAWAAGRPVIVPDDGALGERVAQSGGGWRLGAGFDAQAVAQLLAHLATPDGTREWARVKSALEQDDPVRVPALSTMTREFDALYARTAQPAAAMGDAAGALTPLLAADLNGSVFRRELVRITRGLTDARAWSTKLERDIAELKVAVEKLGADNRRLADVRDAFDRLPAVVRKYLLKRAFRDRR
ncbi:MAG TPA: glycosyltransferase [Casimicrobiaceae bacterium]